MTRLFDLRAVVRGRGRHHFLPLEVGVQGVEKLLHRRREALDGDGDTGVLVDLRQDLAALDDLRPRRIYDVVDRLTDDEDLLLGDLHHVGDAVGDDVLHHAHGLMEAVRIEHLDVVKLWDAVLQLVCALCARLFRHQLVWSPSGSKSAFRGSS